MLLGGDAIRDSPRRAGRRHNSVISRLLLKVCIEKTQVAWSPNVTGKLVEPVEDDPQLRGSIECEHPTVLRLKRESRREKLSSDQVAECARSNETDRAQRQITTVLETRPKNGTGNKRSR